MHKVIVFKHIIIFVIHIHVHEYELQNYKNDYMLKHNHFMHIDYRCFKKSM